MAKSGKSQHQSRVAQRLADFTPEEMAQRWADMRGRYVRWTAFFSIMAGTLYLANRFGHYSQGAVNIMNVAFQIASIFGVLFVVMTAMSLIYGRGARKEQSPRN